MPENFEHIRPFIDEYLSERERLRRAGKSDYDYEVFEARADLLGRIAGREFDHDDWDETTSTWVTWIDGVEGRTPPDQLREKLFTELTFYAKTMPERYQRQDRNQAIKEELMTARPDLYGDEMTTASQSTDTIAPMSRDDIERAVQGYISDRARIRQRDGNLDGSAVTDAFERMAADVGFAPEDFSAISWKHVTEETSRNAYIDVNKAVNYIIKKRDAAQKAAERKDRNLGIKGEIESARDAFDKDRDGLPSGRYEEVGGEFKRVGDTEELEQYHGTVRPVGEIIQEFRPAYGNPDSEHRPSIGNTPAVYTTPDAEAALEYAMGYNNAFVGDDHEGQLYKVKIRPEEIVDLGHCQDDDAARLAIKKGFDTIECPDFWEQHETITFDPKKIEVDAVYPVTEAKDADEPDLDVVLEGDRQIDELKSQGFLGDPIYRREDKRMGNVREAVGEYRDANPPASSLGAPKGIAEKFPHMFPKTSMSASTSKTSGRGRLY